VRRATCLVERSETPRSSKGKWYTYFHLSFIIICISDFNTVHDMRFFKVVMKCLAPSSGSYPLNPTCQDCNLALQNDAKPCFQIVMKMKINNQWITWVQSCGYSGLHTWLSTQDMCGCHRLRVHNSGLHTWLSTQDMCGCHRLRILCIGCT
jgi:hypothetical protein